MTTGTAKAATVRRGFRQLPKYPDAGRRTLYLGIVVLATVVLYYELYVQGAVSTQIIAAFDMNLRYYILVSIVGNLVGALASLGAGVADRFGRANMLLVGLLVTGLLILFGLPNAPNRTAYLVIFAVVSLVEGMALVATPALVRDFSPQVGRATAMGFWTLGPVLGSLIVTVVASTTLDSHPDWRFQFYVCGIVGLVVFVIAFVGLRELAPPIRDQIMVSSRDRALVEARAAGIDPVAAERGGWRAMLRVDILGSAVAISLYLIFYYVAVGFFVVYFAVTFGYTEQRANSLANWYWMANAVTLVLAGLLSDRLRVRKPFMVGGAVVSAVGIALFAMVTTDRNTSYGTFAAIIVVISAGSGFAYAAWMACFTETVERQNPAGTAKGLAVFGGTIRTVVTLLLITLSFFTGATALVVDRGPTVRELSTTYAAELGTLGKLSTKTVLALQSAPADPTVQAQAVSEIAGVRVADVAKALALSTQYAEQLETVGVIDRTTLLTLAVTPGDTAAQAAAVTQIAAGLKVSVSEATARLVAVGEVPVADLTFLVQNGPPIQQAAAQLKALADVPAADAAYLLRWAVPVQTALVEAPKQWQVFWWIAFAGQIIFIPLVLTMAGGWSPRQAKRKAEEHADAVERELAELTVERPVGSAP